MAGSILFNPNSMNVSHPSYSTDLGFFDSVLNPDKGVSIAGGKGGFELPRYFGRNMVLAAGGLQMYAQTSSSMAQIDNIMANIERTELNIDQIEIEMMDRLDIQARKVSKRHGTQMARVGASGVAFSGSPLMVMAESYKRGMEDYQAVEKQGRFAIDSAYQNIYDSLDQVEDISKSIMFNAVTTLAGTAYGYKATGK